MTAPEPTWKPVPAPVTDLADMPRWCSSCEIHRTTTKRPLCPGCLDLEREKAS